MKCVSKLQDKCKVYKNRRQALKFANKVNGNVKWYQYHGSIKKKDKFTGKIKSTPALITGYKVYY